MALLKIQPKSALLMSIVIMRNWMWPWSKQLTTSSVLLKSVISEKSSLPLQRFGLVLMLLIAFMLFPADWPKPIVGRLLREGDPTFREELLNFSQRGHILQLSNFKDDSSPIAWDCSAWVRTYALFLEERLECFKILKYDIEAERLPRPGQGPDKVTS
ncbi:hypothetical protein OIU78_004769 [Salix suchowensis]|nr:hypothetical protein OIU78_004769 [Salix suchowensis]